MVAELGEDEAEVEVVGERVVAASEVGEAGGFAVGVGGLGEPALVALDVADEVEPCESLMRDPLAV
ncbi:MAG: hypothetical protein H6705_04220 [Myxococcales bacterium]|nr:hypothetical protein [Myxococcales bacterium]